MSDDTSAAGTQADPEDAPQAGTPEGTQAEPTKPSPKMMSVAEDEWKKQLAENKSLRTRLKQIDDKSLTDAEKLKQEHETASKERDQYKSLYSGLLVEREAQKLGFANPELAHKLIRDALDFGDDGKPTNATELLSALLKSDPYLKAEQPKTEPPKPAISAAGGNRAQASTGQPQPQTLAEFPRLGRGGLFKDQ